VGVAGGVRGKGKNVCVCDRESGCVSLREKDTGARARTHRNTHIHTRIHTHTHTCRHTLCARTAKHLSTARSRATVLLSWRQICMYVRMFVFVLMCLCVYFSTARPRATVLL